jgi:F-type H+-transporting ATPase subunit epsilon
MAKSNASSEVLTIELSVTCAAGDIYSGQVRWVVVPSPAGELGIYPRHSPLLARVSPGELRLISKDGDNDYLYVCGGIVEVQPFAVTVLADTVLRGEQIDAQAAREVIARAENIQRTARLYIDRDNAHLEMVKALAQLRVLEHTLKKKRPR